LQGLRTRKEGQRELREREREREREGKRERESCPSSEGSFRGYLEVGDGCGLTRAGPTRRPPGQGSHWTKGWEKKGPGREGQVT
jgi:hypothetical protein